MPFPPCPEILKTVEDLGVEMESRNGVRNLMFKSVEIDGKMFYFQLKEEREGKQFMIISNKVNNGRSGGLKYSIFLPSPSISTFLQSFHACISSHQHHHFLHNKLINFTFDIGHNQWGTFLKVSESSVDKYQGTTSLFIPSGRNQNKGWETFGRVLTEITTTSKLIFPPVPKQISDPSDQVDVSACIISGESDETSSASQLKTDSSSSDESSSFGISRMMRAGPITFVFDLQGNKSSPSLRISQLMGTSRSSIFVPLSAGKQFHEMVCDFLKISNDFGEGSSVADGEQSSSPQAC